MFDQGQIIFLKMINVAVKQLDEFVEISFDNTLILVSTKFKAHKPIFTAWGIIVLRKLGHLPVSQKDASNNQMVLIFWVQMTV